MATGPGSDVFDIAGAVHPGRNEDDAADTDGVGEEPPLVEAGSSSSPKPVLSSPVLAEDPWPDAVQDFFYRHQGRKGVGNVEAAANSDDLFKGRMLRVGPAKFWPWRAVLGGDLRLH